MILKTFKKSVLTMAFVGLTVSCSWGDDDEKSNDTPAPSTDTAQAATENEEAEAVTSDRTLRSGPQFYAAVAKLLSIKMADLRGDYNNVKSEFASSSSFTEMHPGMWIAATRLSSKACQLHFESVVKPAGKEKYDEYLNSIYDQVILDAAQKGTSRAEIESLVAKIENEDVKFRTTCALLAASLVFY